MIDFCVINSTLFYVYKIINIYVCVPKWYLFCYIVQESIILKSDSGTASATLCRLSGK